jgi:hypothetical protein
MTDKRKLKWSSYICSCMHVSWRRRNSHIHPQTFIQSSNWSLNYQNSHFSPWICNFGSILSSVRRRQLQQLTPLTHRWEQGWCLFLNFSLLLQCIVSHEMNLTSTIKSRRTRGRIIHHNKLAPNLNNPSNQKESIQPHLQLKARGLILPLSSLLSCTNHFRLVAYTITTK